MQSLLVEDHLPSAVSHSGGVWEREIQSVKSALYTTVGAQPVTEEVLQMVLTEVEENLYSKPLGYVSSNVRDPNPMTLVLLMMRLDGSLPQVRLAGCPSCTSVWRR